MQNQSCEPNCKVSWTSLTYYWRPWRLGSTPFCTFEILLKTQKSWFFCRDELTNLLQVIWSLFGLDWEVLLLVFDCDRGLVDCDGFVDQLELLLRLCLCSCDVVGRLASALFVDRFAELPRRRCLFWVAGHRRRRLRIVFVFCVDSLRSDEVADRPHVGKLVVYTIRAKQVTSESCAFEVETLAVVPKPSHVLRDRAVQLGLAFEFARSSVSIVVAALRAPACRVERRSYCRNVRVADQVAVVGKLFFGSEQLVWVDIVPVDVVDVIFVDSAEVGQQRLKVFVFRVSLDSKHFSFENCDVVSLAFVFVDDCLNDLVVFGPFVSRLFALQTHVAVCPRCCFVCVACTRLRLLRNGFLSRLLFVSKALVRSSLP